LGLPCFQRYGARKSIDGNNAKTMTSDDVIIRRDGRAGRITMNRPEALNALTYAMVGGIMRALDTWRDDPAIELVILDGTGDRALCAGGDVLWLYASRTEGSAKARQFWAEEYRLNAAIKRYPKPFVALMDGIVMGGGIGLSAHASHRIVTERSMLAMPETGIGLIPDVGGTWLLSHAPGETGTYLGLTGARMAGADAIYAGFADTFVLSSRLPELPGALGAQGRAGIDAAIAAVASDPPPSELRVLSGQIDRAFRGDSVEAICAALGDNASPWASKTLVDLKLKSPKALKAAFAALRAARTLPSLESALDVEFRLVTRLFEDGEFIEGVRALLVDKDKKPKWRPGTLAEVTHAGIVALMAPLALGQDLNLAGP
jgi:enoyl-CoA hydratase